MHPHETQTRGNQSDNTVPSLASWLGLIAILFLSSTRSLGEDYVFSTLAGRSNLGGMDGIGGEAQLCVPYGVAVDTAGNVFVADSFNSTIRKITPDAIVTTIAGRAPEIGSLDGTGSAARFRLPRGIAADDKGNCYVADTFNHTIRKIDSEGEVTTVAGIAGRSGSSDGVGTEATFSYPWSIAVDSMSNLYVSDTTNHAIRKITAGGAVTTLAGLAGVAGSSDGIGQVARFNSPKGIAVDGVQNVYVSDRLNQMIRKISPDGAVTTVAGSAGNTGATDGTGAAARFNYPEGLAIDGAGIVYVSDSQNSSVRMVSPGGEVTTLVATNLDGSRARIYFPGGIAAAKSGTLYVADNQDSLIQKISPFGAATYFAGRINASGTNDGVATDARFTGPYGIAVDLTGTVYVSEYYSHTIRKVTPDGLVTTFAGVPGFSGNSDGPVRSATFNHPEGLAVDTFGALYVADYGNRSVRKITRDGMVTTLAKANFDLPTGIACDSSGNIYIADSGDQKIRRIDTNGVVFTLAGDGHFGSNDGQGAAARFDNPSGVAVDSANIVYVADWLNQTIRKITPDTTVTTFAGIPLVRDEIDGIGKAAAFGDPTAIAADRFGNLFVTDGSGKTIRKISPAGAVTTIAGMPNIWGSADGIGQLARFFNPFGIAVDQSGNVYVADFSSKTIRIGRPANPSPSVASIEIRRESEAVVLSWPVSLGTFDLEARSQFDSKSLWATVTGSFATVGDRFVVTNEIKSAAQFYRLKH